MSDPSDPSNPTDGEMRGTPRDVPPQDGTGSGAGGTGRPRAFRRDTGNGMLGGVAAGLARYLAVDVIWVRLGFVLATVIGWGLGLVLYVAAWLIVPAGDAAPREPGPGGRSGRGPAFWAGVVLVTAGAAMLLDTLSRPLARVVWFDPFDALFPLILIGIGVAIWRSGRERAGAAPGLGGPEAPGPGRFETSIEEVAQRAEARADLLREARSRARVAPITLGAALLVLGAAWLLAAFEVPGMTVTRALSAALLVIGLGLIVGAFLGRGRGLIAAGLVLAPVVVAATLAAQFPGGLDKMSDGKDGNSGIVVDSEDRVLRPTDLDQLARSYEFEAGSIVLDLRALDAAALAGAGEVRIEVELGAGELRAILPDDVAADVRVELGLGQVEIAGGARGGIGMDVRRTFGDRTDGGDLIDLRIEQGVGSVEVER